jgi:hypothetical protein
VRKVQKLKIEYCGFSEPETKDELTMEILGLKNAIQNAELRISMLKQGLQLNIMMKKDQKTGETQNEKIVETPDTKNQ